MSDNEIEEKRSILLASAGDLVSSLCFYDRKDDEELSVEDVVYLINNHHISATEILDKIKNVLKENFPNMLD